MAHKKLARAPSARPRHRLLERMAGCLRRAGPAVLLLGLLAGGARAASIAGLWLIEDGDAVIKIESCGSTLCGRIVGIGTFSSDGQPPRDNLGRSQCGLEIIHALAPRPDGRWLGTITNPEDGRTYSVRLSLDDPGRLRLRGYVGIPLLGSTQIWTAYAGTLNAQCRMTR